MNCKAFYLKDLFNVPHHSLIGCKLKMLVAPSDQKELDLTFVKRDRGLLTGTSVLDAENTDLKNSVLSHTQNLLVADSTINEISVKNGLQNAPSQKQLEAAEGGVARVESSLKKTIVAVTSTEVQKDLVTTRQEVVLRQTQSVSVLHATVAGQEQLPAHLARAAASAQKPQPGKPDVNLGDALKS